MTWMGQKTLGGHFVIWFTCSFSISFVSFYLVSTFSFPFLKQQTERVRATDEMPAEQHGDHPSPPHRPRGDETNQLPNPRYICTRTHIWLLFSDSKLLHLTKPVKNMSYLFLGHISPPNQKNYILHKENTAFLTLFYYFPPRHIFPLKCAGVTYFVR